MTEQIFGDRAILDLPESVAKKLDRALSKLSAGNLARVQKTAFEGALNHTLFVETETERYVFRARRETFSVESEEYMKAMYECMGLFGVGGTFELRTIAEEIQFMENAAVASLPVPKLIASESDWMLMEFLPGKTLHESVKMGEVGWVFTVLKAMNLAHQRGIIYGDRWGDNELIDSQGNISFIDFDIKWGYEGSEAGMLEALEMAVTLFNSLRLTTAREELLNLVETEIVPWLKSCGYRLEKIAKFAECLGNFYLNPDKPSNMWSLPSSLYLALREPRDRLVSLLAEA